MTPYEYRLVKELAKVIRRSRNKWIEDSKIKVDSDTYTAMECINYINQYQDRR